MTRWQGGLINRLQEGAPASVPNVGDGATLFMWSDRHAYTVRSVKVSPSGKTIEIEATQDKATRTDGLGMSDSQSYSFETVEDAPRELFKSVSGRPFKRMYHDSVTGKLTMGDTILRVGHRSEYYDYSH